ncbi:MAG: H-type small acid-soluble spore protein [Firmicutes bacterium]|nr:H-type small acid-soluble spore protein [Bacillota bacterium]
MDRQRAKEILQTKEKIEVHYQGTPVWIEGIYGSTANVTVMGTCRTMDVPVADLEEKGTKEH